MYASFHQNLRKWYQKNGRHDLPWRNSRDAYAIYVSEVMLQQTQVKTVLERFYFPFLERFPTLQALADAPQDEVLKYWQGLGYYNRAINLHKAAKACAPTLPSHYDGLMALSGIGQNTAHAILAFAYHQPVAVLEANVKRVVHRIFALKSAKPTELWHYAGKLVDSENPFDYNQAMMDVGAMICTPKAPQCDLCPARTICRGKSAPEAYPQKAAAKQTPVRKKNIVVLMDTNGRCYMRLRQSRFLNGLYGFIEQDRLEKILQWQGEAHALNAANKLGRVTQTYSHFKLDADVYEVRLGSAQNGQEWVALADVAALPLSRADEKVLKLVADINALSATRNTG